MIDRGTARAGRESDGQLDALEAKEPGYIFVDHWLGGLGAHPVRMASIFLESREEAVAYGRDSCELEHPRVRRLFKTPTRPARHRFPPAPNPAASGWRKLRHHVACFAVMVRTNAKYFCEIFRVPRRSNEIWFCPNTTLFTLPGLVVYAGIFRSQRVVGYIQNAPSRHFKLCGRLLRLLRIRRLEFVAEEEAMSERASEFLRRPVATVLFPLLPPRWFAAALPVSGALPRPLRIAVLGMPRREKGYHYLPRLVEELRPELARGTMSFVIQSRAHDVGLEKLEAEDAALHEVPGVQFIAQALSPEEYLQALSAADVVFTPYLKEAYAQRLSWISIEALALGKPVLLTDETLAANWLKKYRAGIFFQDGDIAGMAAGLRQLTGDWPLHQAAAVLASERFRADNSPEHFFAKLTDLFR